MMKSPSNAAKSKSKAPRARRAGKPRADGMSQATVDEFEREGMGVAAKE